MFCVIQHQPKVLFSPSQRWIQDSMVKPSINRSILDGIRGMVVR